MSDKSILPDGVWPVMLTPFLPDAVRTIDWSGLDSLVSWYLDAGVSGLFACCLSSEAYQLTGDEQAEITRRVLGVTNGRVPVVVGVIGQATEAERIDQIRISRDLGAAAVVLNIAEWATHDETDDVLVDRLENLAERVRGVDFGLYECPVPYHRLLGVDTVGRIARTGRFTFFKETSSNIDSLAGKINVSRGTRLRVYNANAELLSAAMMLGAAGYSGIEANYCPALCAWLCRNADSGSRAERVQHLITMLHNDRIQRKYPTITKAFMELDGLPIDSACRSQRYQLDDFDYDAIRAYKQQFDQMKRELASHALIPVMTKRKPSSGNVPAG